MAREIGRGYAAYLTPEVGVSRDMRVSSPAIAAAFIDGVRMQGTTVVDFGMLPTDAMYFAVANGDLEGGAQITASHNPGAVQRHQDGPRRGAAAQRRRGHRRYPRHDRDDRLPPPAATPGRLTTRDIVDPYVEKVMSFIDPSIVKPFKVVLDAGSGMAGLVAPKMFDAASLQDHQAVLRHRRDVPESRGQSPHRREPSRYHRGSASGRRPTSASPGTATPTAASSSTAAASSSPGTSSRRCWLRPSC